MTRGRAPATAAAQIETLKAVLEKAQTPEELQDHPWAASALVGDLLAKHPELQRLAPGRRLLLAIADLFQQTMPSLPPRKGIRLDTRWGEFGILAARYFAPLKFGIPFPTSMRDAWGRIDEAILLFVFGEDAASRSEQERSRYRLVGGEQEVAAESTLSDWHRKGLERLAAVIQVAHDRLAQSAAASGPGVRRDASQEKRARVRRRVAWIAGGALLILTLAWGGARGYRSYLLAQKVRSDLTQLPSVSLSSPNIEAVQQLRSQLPGLSSDVAELDSEAAPFLLLGKLFGWVPAYGGDIAHADDLMQVAGHMLASAEIADPVLSPFLQDPASAPSRLSLEGVVSSLADARPQLLKAQEEITLAQEARARIVPERLSPGIREILTERIDPALGWMEDGLSLGVAAPGLMGAGSDGPKTYLILVQNEDELRATGGFITAVGKLVVSGGRVLDLTFADSGQLDNWSMPYPMAPWQLQEYMNSRVLILRDANWFPDFPTAVLYVKQLYAYVNQDSVDGVIAVDQQLLVMLLGDLGPIQVQGADYPITAGNVIEYMRGAKLAADKRPLQAGQTEPADKAFMGTLSKSLMQKALAADAQKLRELSVVIFQALQEHHLLLQMDQADMAALLQRHDWDGELSAGAGDFLMVVDSNIGFNKTNAVVDTELTYDVDLSDPAAPVSSLAVKHVNHASADVKCIQWDTSIQATVLKSYPIDRCYWDYMRVYVPQGARVLDATPQTVPDAWMILNRHVVPRVDVLDEGLPGLASFGTLLVVPGSAEVTTDMRFGLSPTTTLHKNADGTFTYALTVKKQPGTLAVPIAVRLRLPAGASIIQQTPTGTAQGQDLVFARTLQQDQQIRVVFRLP